MFNHKIIEKKWQSLWESKNTFKSNLDSKKPKYYVLDMFPYPSGQGLHVGHLIGYSATDAISRYKRFKGFEVLHPMGWDAFGLPAEQYAIKTGNSPQEFTQKNINNFRRQLKSLGFSYDWSKELNTTDPNFYKTTQWIFSKLYEHKLAVLKEIEVNWSPSLNTVLSNEEVIENSEGENVSERDGKKVIKKNMKQWVLKITEYADKIFEGLDSLEWPDSIKKLQKNWIYEKDNEKYTKKLKLRDWVFARQRYWGEPFPIVHLDNEEIFLIPYEEFPIELPKILNYKFSTDEKPALSNAKDWMKYNHNGIKGTRDLNTMPQWAGSCWYYIAFLLVQNGSLIELNSERAKILINKWLPVDLYIGGQEHAVLHFMYARFWHLFLKNIGILDVEEPFQKLFTQGMILGPDGTKMSKSKGNVINPDDLINKFGADALRVYEMFMGALGDDKSWNEKGVESSRDWLERVNRFFTKKAIYIDDSKTSEIFKEKYNLFISNIDKAVESLKLNIVISEMMTFLNFLYKNKEISLNFASKGFLQILSIIAPHISNEIWEKISNDDKLLSEYNWPSIYNFNLRQKDRLLIIQIDGKIRGKIFNNVLNENSSKEELLLVAKEVSPNYIKDPDIILFIKNKIISISNKSNNSNN